MDWGGGSKNGDRTDSRAVLEAPCPRRVNDSPNGSLLWHSPLPQVGRYKSLTIRIMRSRFASANFWDMEVFRKSLIRHC